MAQIFLISCVRTKLESKAIASDLYTSALFRKAMEVARRQSDKWYILSAKYGLVQPDQIIEPYELTLTRMPKPARIKWATSVWDQLKPRIRPGDKITFLAGERYCEELSRHLTENRFEVRRPLCGMGIGKQLAWLTQQARGGPRTEHLNRFYDLLNVLSSGLNGPRTLSECSGKNSWPQRGVYLFFEPGEERLTTSVRRVVRVGTHAVSRGAQSSLWQRLRTHLGTDSGGGNHRGSIFRLHVGAALIAKSNGSLLFPHWGVGQTASALVREGELALEREVSEYIGRMSVIWVAIDDRPGPKSDRSYIEKNAIGLLSGPKGPIDPPSKMWLGRSSLHSAIRQSGLWNINYTDNGYDPAFLDVFERLVEMTIGKRRLTDKSLAPRHWHLVNRRRERPDQPILFPDDS